MSIKHRTPKRQIRVDGDVAYVPLTQGYEAVIDVSDVPLVDKWDWYALVQSDSVYAVRNQSTPVKKTLVLMHRVLMDAPEGFQVDHRDGIGTNNRRSNMRLSSHQQNATNRRVYKKSRSGMKGASFQKGKWRASIMRNKKNIHLGYFDTPEAAHDAYVAASVIYHGEFRRSQ